MENIFREYKTRAEFDVRSRLDFPAHIHDDAELVYVLRGGGDAYCGGKRYHLRAGAIFVAFPNQVHCYSDCTGGEYIVLIVNPSNIQSLEYIMRESQPESSVYIPKDDTLAELLKEALQEKQQHGQSGVLDAYFALFFGKLIREMTLTKNSERRDTAANVLQYCGSHFKDNITVDSVAEALHLSRSSVSHIFSTQLKVNFCQYINTLRIDYAVKLMENKSRSVTEIAYMSGFSTIRTFNRAFLKKYGVSPSQYRKDTIKYA